MTNRVEDIVGRAMLIVIFAFLALQQFGSVVAVSRNREAIEFWQLVLVSRVFSFIFLTLTVALTVIRLPPRNTASGLEPRVTAIFGTFCLMLLVVLPSGQPGAAFQILATVLIVAGTLLSIWCIVFLGRSFSVMATARRLVTHGPYALIRHPLYAAEAVTVAGTIIANWSIWAVVLGVAWWGLQYRRMLNEEQVLRATFPEYDDYARRVPRLVPLAGRTMRA